MNGRQHSQYSIAQLDFARRALEAKLAHGKCDDKAQEITIQRIEAIELALAHTPAADLKELSLKFERLLAALALDTDDYISLEAVIAAAMREDFRRLRQSDCGAKGS